MRGKKVGNHSKHGELFSHLPRDPEVKELHVPLQALIYAAPLLKRAALCAAGPNGRPDDGAGA